jgi:hypothetical protein
MKFRKLRITWTAFCGIACVLLIALWVRSYFVWDEEYRQLLRNFWIASGFGHFSFTSGSGFSYGFPYLLPIMLFAGLAVSPWIHWSRHFSLRTLLIATTLVAVVLGLIVYAAR